LPRDQRRRDRGDGRLPERARRRRHPALARLPLREARRAGPLPLPRRDPREVQAHPRTVAALSEDLLDAALPRVRRRAARLPLHAVGQPDVHAEGLKGPCYLIEGKYYGSWKEFFGGVDWDYWESRQDPRCHNCKMHSGFEPSVVRKLGGSPRDMLTMARWQLTDVRNSAS